MYAKLSFFYRLEKLENRPLLYIIINFQCIWVWSVYFVILVHMWSFVRFFHICISKSIKCTSTSDFVPCKYCTNEKKKVRKKKKWFRNHLYVFIVMWTIFGWFSFTKAAMANKKLIGWVYRRIACRRVYVGINHTYNFD